MARRSQERVSSRGLSLQGQTKPTRKPVFSQGLGQANTGTLWVSLYWSPYSPTPGPEQGAGRKIPVPPKWRLHLRLLRCGAGQMEAPGQ